MLVVGELTPLVTRFRDIFSERRIGVYMTQLLAAPSNSGRQSFQKAFRSHILIGLRFFFFFLFLIIMLPALSSKPLQPLLWFLISTG